jgi:hypothetical protein
MPRKLFILAIGVLALAASLALSTAAGARGGDRNGDRIPDRWEKQHHLSLKVSQAQRDTDQDGLNNRGEYQAGLDPRDDDSDDDGTEDGQENAGSIASFTGGVLTVTLAGGGTLTATVTPDTEIECDDSTASASSSGGGPGDDGDNDDDHGDRQNGRHGGDESDDHEGDDGGNCDAEALTVGRKVAEGELKTAGGGVVWKTVELGA